MVAFGPFVRGDAPPTTSGHKAAIIALNGQIDDYTRDGLIRRFERAKEAGAQVVILDIDSPGGLVTSSLEISLYLKRQDNVHTIAYVRNKAISGAAMVSLACNEIWMSPSSTIGDCAPIVFNIGGALESLPAAERAKQESPILRDFEDSAQRNGYSPVLARAMVSVERCVYFIQNPSGEKRIVDESEYKKLTADGGWSTVPGFDNPVDGPTTLLTLYPKSAVGLGLAKGTIGSAAELAGQNGYVVVADLRPGWGEGLIEWLNGGIVRAILLTIFLTCLYIALNAPGHGAAEAVAVVSLGVLVGVPVVQVRGNAETHTVVGHVAPVPRHVVDVRVEIVGRRKPEHRAGDERDVGIVGNAGQLQRTGLGAAASRNLGLALQKIARPSAGRHGCFDSPVDSGEVGRELATHRMPMGADPRPVHFWLLFQKGDTAARGHQHQKPIAVPRRFHRIECELIRQERPGEVVRLVALRRMRGVEFPPIGLRPAPRLLAEAHLVAAPIDRKAGITAPGVGHDAIERSRLPAPVQLDERWEFRSTRRIGIKRRDPRRCSFKNADLIADNPADDAVLLPFLEHFDLQRRSLVEGRKVRPKLVERPRDVGRLPEGIKKEQCYDCAGGAEEMATALANRLRRLEARRFGVGPRAAPRPGRPRPRPPRRW